MATTLPEIVRCPAELRAEALALVLCELAPSQRRIIASSFLAVDDTSELASEPLYVALSDNELYGAAWGQRQSGNIAVFWPPRIANGEDETTAIGLALAVVRDLDASNIALAQSLLAAPSIGAVQVMQSVGFRHAADLLYMASEAAGFPLAAPTQCGIQFVPYKTSQRARLLKLVARSYEGTLDCTALNGARDLDDVINGYQATGVFRPDNWYFVQANGADIGVLLLADHRQAGYWELMYMGLVPEVRGRGWGRQIARYAQWLARGAGVDRVVVAVDAANTPAVTVYRSTGFAIWERRAAYLRFPPHRGT